MRGLIGIVLAAWALPVAAIEFRSVAEPAVILYDAPSKDSARLFVLSRDYPVEVIIGTDGWVRVRDDSGAFGWVEAKSLSNRRTVMVKTPAEARQAPNDSAPAVFKAEQGLVLELQTIVGGWAQVRHRDGASGYLKLSQLWGV
ncbi:MAG TPA: SH3 domain-containing protein [Burkholderiales bacterium]|jgi:SH3-like domain-containing protein|nr:SH3 domain-containing protein [Burkholderiales bacterium]